MHVKNIDTFVRDLRTTLDVFDLATAATMCDQLRKELIQGKGPIPSVNAERIMQALRNKRMFALMQKMGDVFMQTGHNSLKVRRQYAQAMIDQGNFSAALSILNEIISQTEDDKTSGERIEAKGLVGRIYKQLYVNADSPKNPTCKQYLELAVKSYNDVYALDNERTWHGVNVLALLKRAHRDKVELSVQIDADTLAREIIKTIETRHHDRKADAWDFATAAEASLALDNGKEALEWLSGYARMNDCDAFELASCLRQLEEVWQLSVRSKMGQLLLPLLRAELMKRSGGVLDITHNEIKLQNSLRSKIDANYSRLIGGEMPAERKSGAKPEKVFDQDSFQTSRWVAEFFAMGKAVARIHKHLKPGFGTGFLLPGGCIKKSLGKELVLLTNAHVVSADPKENALGPDEAIASFETLASKELSFKNLKIIWSSPSSKLDATILRFSQSDQKKLRKLTSSLNFYVVTEKLPAIDKPPKEKVYVIGHPYGGVLQYSFQDNLLLDHDFLKLHYRTPTAGGSSGSPVFNSNLELIGIHHAGDEQMQCLNGKKGIYQANEGIWIQKIIKELNPSKKKKKPK